MSASHHPPRRSMEIVVKEGGKRTVNDVAAPVARWGGGRTSFSWTPSLQRRLGSMLALHRAPPLESAWIPAFAGMTEIHGSALRAGSALQPRTWTFPDSI